MVIETEGSPDLAALLEVFGEDVPHPLESARHCSVDLCHAGDDTPLRKRHANREKGRATNGAGEGGRTRGVEADDIEVVLPLNGAALSASRGAGMRGFPRSHASAPNFLTV